MADATGPAYASAAEVAARVRQRELPPDKMLEARIQALRSEVYDAIQGLLNARAACRWACRWSDAAARISTC